MRRLEARVAELREETHTLEVLNRTGIAIGAELDLERLVQIVTDAGVELSGAQFGAFFYNVIPRGWRSLYPLHAFRARREKLSPSFPCPATRDLRAHVPGHRSRPLCRHSCGPALRQDGAI